MRVQNNITVFSGDTRNNAQAEWTKKEGTYSYDQKSRSVYAGNFLKEFPLREKIQQKKAEAQQRAMKIVGDAWDADKVIDNEIMQRQERIGELREDNKDAMESLKEFRQMEEDLREGYGVAADSEEQMDLELMKRNALGQKLTEEEKERLAEIRENGMTDYQTRALELDKAASYYRKVIAENNILAAEESDVIQDIRAERNKYHPVLDAQEQHLGQAKLPRVADGFGVFFHKNLPSLPAGDLDGPPVCAQKKRRSASDRQQQNKE